ncbi:Single-stranded DNA-binding protein 3 [Apodemus speciosus]|uniref:Single-stranded DNA-binding protein 3 n=1 Tax=Apodemus speciosus TaxID=105296 RepID=A0ABQ0FHA1_APOSI
MYGKGKSNSSAVPSDSQAREKLALYVYEYLLHVGAQKSAQTFLSEDKMGKKHHIGGAARILTFLVVSAAAAPSPPFMSPRYPGGPRPPLRIPNQALGGVPGSQPLLPSGMDPTRQQGHPNMGGPMQRMTPPRGMVPLGPQNYGGAMRPPLNALGGPGMPGMNIGVQVVVDLGQTQQMPIHQISKVKVEIASVLQYLVKPSVVVRRGLQTPGKIAQLPDTLLLGVSWELCTVLQEAEARQEHPSCLVQQTRAWLQAAPSIASEAQPDHLPTFPPCLHTSQFPMGPGSDGPMGGLGGMEPHHMNGSLGSGDMDSISKNSPNNMSLSNQPGTPRDDGEMGGNFLNPFQSESYSPSMTMSV